MIPKGAGDVRNLRSLNTRPGPITEGDAFRRLYLLACEKSGLEKKKRFGERQVRQASKRLGEVKMQMMKLKGPLERFKGGNPGEVVLADNPKNAIKSSSLKY